MAAIARRDVLTAVRYRGGFLLGMAGSLTELAAIYFLARAIGPEFRPQGLSYFTFLLVGTGFYTFLIGGVNSFVTTVADAQRAGTLEVLATSSTPLAVLILLSAISTFMGSALNFILYLTAGLVLFGRPFHLNLSASTVVFVLSLGVLIAIGILAAATQLAIQRGSAVVWLLSSGTWLLTGTLFPVSSLPIALRRIAALIPVTHSLDAMRLALLEGVPFSTLSREIAVLGVFCVLLVPFSLHVFAFTLRRARLQGTLSFY